MAATKRNTKPDTAVTAVADKAQSVEVGAKAAKSKPSSPAGSKLPCAVQFPLTVALSFALSTLGSVVMAGVSKGELESLTRSQNSREEMAVLAGWRIIELALAWFGNLDSLEAAAMNVLAHGPAFYLLAAFYNLTPAVAISALTVDILSIALPIYLVRPLSQAPQAATKLNRDLVDIPMQLYTTALATGIYTVTLVLSLRFVLPRILVVYFSGLPSMEPAYGATYTEVLPVTVLLGLAASTFIFSPFATTGKAKEDAEIEKFDPVSASLGQTVWWNFWGYTAKTKVVIQRTAMAIFLTGVSTYLGCTRTIYGVESIGAAAYAAVWVAGAFFTGVGLGLVGGD